VTTLYNSVILGPPGTGKTTRLLRVALDLVTHDEQKHALFVSHTTIAAKELGKRCKMERATVKTLHGACYHLLQLATVQVVDARKLAAFGRLIGVNFEGDDPWPKEALSLQSFARCAEMTLEDAYTNSSRPCTWGDFRYLVNAYDQWKERNGFVDYTDMLERVAERKPETPWKAVFIDEAQDFSHLHWKVAHHLMRSASTVVIAGDDDQAIFEWGGADPHGIDSYIASNKPSVEVLTQSYRVPRATHGIAVGIVKRITRRLEKDYAPRDADGSHRYVGDFESLTVDDLCGSTVLYRDKSARDDIDEHLNALRLRYTSSRPPYSPYDRREAKVMRIIARLSSDANATMSAAEEKMVRMNLSNAAFAVFDKGGVAALSDWRPSALFDSSPYDVVEYLEAVDVTKPADVKLSTIHNFKGAEDGRVILCTQMSERVASGAAINPDEEHRVWYVGVTRAKESLITVGGDNEYQIQ